MRPVRHLAVLATAALFTSGLAAVPLTAGAQERRAPTAGYRWCATTAAPCVERLFVDGVEKFSDDPTYDAYMDFIDGDAENFQLFMHENGGYQLQTDADYRVVVDTGSLNPRVVTGWLADGEVSRARTPSGFRVTVEGSTVDRLNACSFGTCPYTAAPDDAEKVWLLTVDDGTWWDENPVEVAGMEYFSNINENTIPPEYDNKTGVLSVTLANAHESAGGVTFLGSASFRIPHRFIADVWEVPDPETMVGSSLAATLGSGTGDIDVYQDPAGGAMRIDLSGVTFSKRKLKITVGTVTPTRTKVKDTDRTSATRGTVVSTRAEARGAEVTGYAARCTAGKRTVTAKSGGRKVVVRGLTPGRAYDCQVRALSQAGPGKWSKKERLARR